MLYYSFRLNGSFMGGIGSGRRFQNRRGPSLEEIPHLDVRVLKRSGLFDQSTSNGSIKWTNTGLSVFALEYAYADVTADAIMTH